MMWCVSARYLQGGNKYIRVTCQAKVSRRGHMRSPPLSSLDLHFIPVELSHTNSTSLSMVLISRTLFIKY